MLAPLLLALAAAAAPATSLPPAPALAGGRLALVPAVARPGDAVLVRFQRRPGEGLPASGSLAGRPLVFFERGAEAWAVGSLAIETAPGTVGAEVVEKIPGDQLSASVEVVEPGFPSR